MAQYLKGEEMVEDRRGDYWHWSKKSTVTIGAFVIGVVLSGFEGYFTLLADVEKANENSNATKTILEEMRTETEAAMNTFVKKEMLEAMLDLQQTRLDAVDSNVKENREFLQKNQDLMYELLRQIKSRESN